MNHQVDHVATSYVRANADTFVLKRVGKSWKGWLVGSVACLWLILTVPPMVLSQWFPLDLPTLYDIGQDIRQALGWIVSPHNGSGRYFPIYWLYYGLQYQLFEDSVWQYHLIQSLIFLAAAALTARILYRMTGSLVIAGVLFVAIYLSSPVAENLTTLGKGEPLSYFFAVCIICSFYDGRLGARGAWLHCLAVSVLFALALWTKETSLALLGFAATGLTLSAAMKRLAWTHGDTTPATPYTVLLVSLVVGLGIARAPYYIFPATVEGSLYTDYPITSKLIFDNASFYVTQQPDVVFFGVLSVVLLLLGRRLLLSDSSPSKPDNARNLVFATSLCAMAWAYWLALLVWRWPMPYYILLPATIFKLCAIYALYVLGQHRLFDRLTHRLLWASVMAALLYGALVFYYVASSQIAYSRIYTDALRQLQIVSGNRATLVLESYPFYAEQINATDSFLRRLNIAADVHGIADVIDPAVVEQTPPAMLKLLGVTQADIENNVKNIPKKGDYLLAFTGKKLATWFLRGVTPYHSEDSFLKQEGVYDLELVAERRITTPALFLHTWTHRLSAGPTSVGYKLYRVLENEPKFLWKGRYPDGWVGRSSSVIVNSTYARPLIVKLSVPAFALPSTVRITKDGNLIHALNITDTNEIVLNLGEASVDGTLVAFDVPKTVVPKEIKLNKDTRQLGARISLELSAKAVNR